jgi:pimeloyl-ACP methyl ester carboxylesterase
VADALAKRGIRSYAPNLPLGAHPVPMNADADLTPRGIAKIIHSFLVALDLTDVTLVGNDTGGALCQFTIDTDQSRIGRLVLTNCDAFDRFPPKEFVGLVKAGRHVPMVKLLAVLLKSTTIRHHQKVLGGLFAGKPDPVLTRSWVEPALKQKAVRRDAAKLMRGINPAELLEVSTRFGAFSKPVDLVWGDSDAFFPIDFAERLAAAFPRSSLTPVKGARTFVPVEFPDVVADVIEKAPR